MSRSMDILLKSIYIGVLATIFDHIAHLFLYQQGEVFLYYAIKALVTGIAAFSILKLNIGKDIMQKSFIIGALGALAFAGILIGYYPQGFGCGQYTNLLHLAHFAVMSAAAYLVLKFKK